MTTATETTTELMEATYAALCKRGYASLRMQDIADESSKSKATLHYHYESKQDLLYALFDYLTDSFADRIETLEGDTPDAELVALVDTYLESNEEDSLTQFRTALLEIKAQSPYDDRFRTKLTEFDRMLHGRIRSVLEAGQEAEVFRSDIDPDETAEFIVTVLNGAQTRHVAVNHPLECTRAALETYVSRQLLAEDADRSEVGLA